MDFSDRSFRRWVILWISSSPSISVRKMLLTENGDVFLGLNFYFWLDMNKSKIALHYVKDAHTPGHIHFEWLYLYNNTTKRLFISINVKCLCVCVSVWWWFEIRWLYFGFWYKNTPETEKKTLKWKNRNKRRYKMEQQAWFKRLLWASFLPFRSFDSLWYFVKLINVSICLPHTDTHKKYQTNQFQWRNTHQI